MDSLRSRPLNRDESPEQLRDLLPPDALPEEGADAGALLEETTRLLVDHSLFNGHPRFFGYITSSAAPVGALADLLASAINANMGAWQLSPIASEIEKQTVRWIAQLIGFPADCSAAAETSPTSSAFWRRDRHEFRGISGRAGSVEAAAGR